MGGIEQLFSDGSELSALLRTLLLPLRNMSRGKPKGSPYLAENAKAESNWFRNLQSELEEFYYPGRDSAYWRNPDGKGRFKKERLLGTNEEDRQLIEGIINGEIRGSSKLYERGLEEDREEESLCFHDFREG